MNTLLYKHKSPNKTFNRRFFHLSPVYAIFSDQISDFDALETKDLDKEQIKSKYEESRAISTEVREDLKKTSDTLNRITARRIFDLRRQDPLFNSELEAEEEKIKTSFIQARNKGFLSKLGTDMLNENSMRNAMLAVHKSEFSATRLNIRRSGQELETANAAKGLVSDIHQLRENMFSLVEADNKLSEQNTPQDLANSTDSDNNKTGSLVDEYSNFAENMPDYGVGGGDD